MSDRWNRRRHNGKWATVYDLHRRYSENGTWPAILLGILADAEETGEIGWFVSADSATVRAHQHAAGAVVSEAELQAALEWLEAKANPASQKTNLPGQMDPLTACSRTIPPNLSMTHGLFAWVEAAGRLGGGGVFGPGVAGVAAA